MFIVPTCIASVLVHVSWLMLASGESRFGWSDWTSEESKYDPLSCPSSGLVTGMKCDNSYCDKMRIHCDQTTRSTTSSHQWSAWFSDKDYAFEGDGFKCPDSRYITGIECAGSNCAKYRLRCSSASNMTPQKNCKWSPTFSDDGDRQEIKYSAGTDDAIGTYLHGLKCKGNRCNIMEAWICQSQPSPPSPPKCLVKSTQGYWRMARTIATAQTETFSWGVEFEHESSKTKEWSSSITATASAGFSVKALGFSAEISSTLAKSVTETVSQSLTTTENHEISYEFTEDHVGKTLWQFVFDPVDSCGNKETIVTRQDAFTEGAFREPCCLPGWALDAPAYTQCRTKSSLISTNYLCTVALGQCRGSSMSSSKEAGKDNLPQPPDAIATFAFTHLEQGNCTQACIDNPQCFQTVHFLSGAKCYLFGSSASIVNRGCYLDQTGCSTNYQHQEKSCEATSAVTTNSAQAMATTTFTFKAKTATTFLAKVKTTSTSRPHATTTPANIITRDIGVVSSCSGFHVGALFWVLLLLGVALI